jgi:hypothetical protein
MASALQAWRPAERGAPACWHGSAHAVPSRARDALSVVLTVLWLFGAASAVRPEVQAWQGLQGKHHGEEGQPLDKEARRGLTQNRGAPVERWGGTARWRSTAVEGARWSPTTWP